MITEFGKEIRKLRIDEGENLSSMSKKIGVSISYLSAIENGNREIPEGFVDKISNIYHLSKERKKRFIDAEINSVNKISISLNSMACQQRHLAFALSRKLNELSADACEEIIKFLGEDENE